MTTNRQRVQQYIHNFNFRKLFVDELGWDNLHEQPLTLSIENQAFTLRPLVEKRGFKVYLCEPGVQGKIPANPLMSKIEHEVTRYAYEHLIIYIDAAREKQVWQWVKRGQGVKSAPRLNRFQKGQSGELLAQKVGLLAIALEEEATLHMADVSGRVTKAFDVERVTRKFYDRFKLEHTAFLNLISGIEARADREWYASLMLNRLMFIYFIQRKGFLDTHVPGRLDGDPNYLTNIPDEAFEKLFSFFDDFDWHLDDRPLRNDREINPDVLGYIFEKYINQKQMGAYYTKEDITEYISKNTIIPYLFDAAEQKCLIAFRPDGPVWSLLRENPDAYIYDAVKKGCDLPLPPEIELGVHDVSRRGEWNRPAPEEYALPTEIWREVVARRTRYVEVRLKLAAGEITSINDLITYNLDIWRFAEDAITYCEGTDLLRAFYDRIESVSVLDPTCGSGAFLFAALNILETLYEACLERMQDLVEEREALDSAIPISKRCSHPDIDHFREILNRVQQHPNRKYFIYKSIIINNLYGVDIMEEDTEICKLRLFLKLVSQIEQFDDIEPLPDIDFNIRAGNTLVGFASQEETQQAIQGKATGKGTTRDEVAFQNQMIFDDRLERIEQKAQEIERDFDIFRKLQTQLQFDPVDMAENKQQIRQKLALLRTELDGYLASEYGIDRHNIKKKEEYDERFAQWQHSHQPFHWWVEFYGIMVRGALDVVIGNPPYVEWSKIIAYSPLPGLYKTRSCGNLYTVICERSYELLHKNGHFGMIVPISCVATDRMEEFRSLWQTKSLETHVSLYSGDAHPSVLFQGVKFRLSIILQFKHYSPTIYSTHFQRWLPEGREYLFSLIS
ncbi:MAG TPA: DNA methyltransferase [Ktedonobacteraceae bacterium]